MYRPCEQASKAALECLDRNNYDKTQCSDFFQAYRDCKKTWVCQGLEILLQIEIDLMHTTRSRNEIKTARMVFIKTPLPLVRSVVLAKGTQCESIRKHQTYLPLSFLALAWVSKS